ncbi:MAG: HlyD family efflux transporter periplasmic adaptor subunit [Planctomycetes bacterium]|nr:HlyD family efflux transporter periplasmic adaptor subunit [Planctomycetota bacterium]
MYPAITFLVSALLLSGPPGPQPRADKPQGIIVPGCAVAPIHDIRVPAREAGVLTELLVERGALVEEDQPLGQIDDADAQVRAVIAENEFKAATRQAENDWDVKAAEATIGVAKFEWEATLDLAGRNKNAVSEFERGRLKLTHDRSKYQYETARVEHDVSGFTRNARQGQLQAVQNEIERRKIKAPKRGVVEERFRNVGEWVQAGDPVYRLVHMDRLRVEGLVNANDVDPAQIEGCPVVIEVKTAGGPVTLNARIDFVSRMVNPSRRFVIAAEVDNSHENGQWKVWPGLEATMDITLRPPRSSRDSQ